MRSVCFFLACLFFLAGCKQDEELMVGEITGVISAYDQYFNLLPDLSGNPVYLYKDTTLMGNTLTDNLGSYSFENIPYGKYRIDYQKRHFTPTWGAHTVYHLGGLEPSFAGFSLYEIPTYELTIDSVDSSNGFYFMFIYVKFKGDTITHSNYYWSYDFIGFASNSPDVTKDHYAARIKGSLLSYSNIAGSQKTAIYGLVYQYEWELEQLSADTIYLTICPLAFGQGYWINEYHPEALGPSSNVFGFLHNP